MDESTVLLIGLLVGQLALSIWLMWRRPYNPLSIVGLLTVLFSYLPAVLLISGAGFESYSWRNFTLFDVTSSHDAALLIGVLNLCLLLGSAAAEQYYSGKGFVKSTTQPTASGATLLYDSQKLGLVAGGFLVLWAAVALVLYQQSGQTLTQFLLPIKQTGIASEQSGYIRSLYLAIPSALVVMSYWKHGRLRFTGWLWVAFALLATFSTHQRRELVTTALLVLSLGMFLGPLRKSPDAARARFGVTANNETRRMRFIVLGVLLAGLMLVPLLWYARVYFTNWSEGSSVNAFEIRSFTDILLGSPSTGFPTFVYIQDFVDNYGTNAMYLMAYPFTIFIPRALWESKPVDLDTILQSNYSLMENPSSFWYGEMYYGFGYLAPVATLLLALFMYRFCLKCQSLPDVWSRTLGALLFMQCVTLFKNGVTVFIIETMVLIALLGFAWLVCRPSRDDVERKSPDKSPALQCDQVVLKSPISDAVKKRVS